MIEVKNLKKTFALSKKQIAANKNKEIICLLHQKGIFNIKDSVVKISELLNISKNTVYLHIRNSENKNTTA